MKRQKNKREIELKVPFILQIQLLENLPLEILHLIVRKFMRVGDVLSLRETSRSMRDKITKELAEKVWEDEKLWVEKKLLENRKRMISAFGKMHTGLVHPWDQPRPEHEQFFQLMLENEFICQQAEYLNIDYQEEKLKEYKYKAYMFNHMKKIGGEKNFLSTDSKVTAVAILWIPIEMSDHNYCKEHDDMHSVMIYEAVLHRWSRGIATTLGEYDDLPYRETRYFPVWGPKKDIHLKIDCLNMTIQGYNGWINDQHFMYHHRRMRLPHQRCLEKACVQED